MEDRHIIRVLEMESSLEEFYALRERRTDVGSDLKKSLKNILLTTKFPQEICIENHKCQLDSILEKINSRKEDPEFLKDYFGKKGYDDIYIGFLQDSISRFSLPLTSFDLVGFKAKHSLTLMRVHTYNNSFLKRLSILGVWEPKVFKSIMLCIKFLLNIEELVLDDNAFSKEAISGLSALEKESGNLSKIEFPYPSLNENNEPNFIILGRIMMKLPFVEILIKSAQAIKSTEKKTLIAFYEKTKAEKQFVISNDLDARHSTPV